jgi:serine/threonine protein phosphatase 1
MLEAFLADPATGPYWRQQGGLETLQSYGIHFGGLIGVSFASARDQLRAALPAMHVQFVSSLKTSFTRHRYFFCHAGARPGVPLEQQSDKDLIWLRND